MNRNPNKRLGAGPSDADEIKAHPFFKDTNWIDVYNRKLIPPKPEIKLIEGEMKYSPLYIDNAATNLNSNRVDGWSFAQNGMNSK